MGYSNGLDMYTVPKTARQATLLFSHDGRRSAATLEWLDRAVEYLSPSAGGRRGGLAPPGHRGKVGMSSAVSVSFSGANWNHRSALDGVPPQRHCSDKLVDLSREPVAFCDVLAVALGHRVREAPGDLVREIGDVVRAQHR